MSAPKLLVFQIKILAVSCCFAFAAIMAFLSDNPALGAALGVGALISPFVMAIVLGVTDE